MSRNASKAPISAHPAFPAIVALWFAALLGVGNLVLPVPLLETLVTVTGLSAIFPSAAPPLGFTARAAIALTGALAGAVIGLLLARQVARSQAPRPDERSYVGSEAQPRRPISAHDELGEEGLGSVSPVAQKRRSLAMAEESRRSEYLETVPLPGQARDPEPSLAEVDDEPDETPLPEMSAPAEAPVQVSTPLQTDEDPVDTLELGAFVSDDLDDDGDGPEIEPANGLEELRRRIHTPSDFQLPQDPPMTERQNFQPTAESNEDDDEWQDFAPLTLDGRETPADPAIPKSFEPDADAGNPLPFAAPSLGRNQTDMAEESEDAHETGPATAEDHEPQFSVVDASDAPFETSDLPDDDRSLEELGLVQLAARLGASIEKRRARRASGPAAALSVVPELARPVDFEAAAAEDAARAIAEFFGPANTTEPAAEAAAASPAADAEPEAGPPAAMPAALSLRLDAETDDDDDDDIHHALAASFALPALDDPAVATAAEPEPQPATEYENEFDEEDLDESEYSSLLAMKNPFARQEEFVRVDEPEADSGDFEPTVTFPAGAAAGHSSAVWEEEPESGPRPFDPPKNPDGSAIRGAPLRTVGDTGNAEQNLRAALATLQRMSGTA